MPLIASQLGIEVHKVKYKLRNIGLSGTREGNKRIRMLSKDWEFTRRASFPVRYSTVDYEQHSVTSMGDIESKNLIAFLDEVGIPEAKRVELIERFRIEIARVVRPKWLGRLVRGGELATLTAPMFLKRVHAEDIGADGTVPVDIIRGIDPELMRAVDGYISQRIHRGLDLGDAQDLKFASRPEWKLTGQSRRGRPRNP
jgi:hypothetical protein